MILALRHARTLHADGPLGRRDVAIVGTHEAAAALVAPEPLPVRVWSSPLSRCAGTAAVLAARLQVPHSIDERLLEIDYGHWEGRTWAELERDESFAAWMNDWQEVGPPGGESARQVERRVAAWRATLTDEVHLLIGHAGVIRALHVLCRGSSWHDAMALAVPHLALTRFTPG